MVRRHERKYLVVRQPDGTLAYLPEWMTSPRAASFDVCEVPALAREALSELRGVIDAFFLSATEPKEGGSDDATARKDATGKAVRAGEPHDHGSIEVVQGEYLGQGIRFAACGRAGGCGQPRLQRSAAVRQSVMFAGRAPWDALSVLVVVLSVYVSAVHPVPAWSSRWSGSVASCAGRRASSSCPWAPSCCLLPWPREARCPQAPLLPASFSCDRLEASTLVPEPQKGKSSSDKFLPHTAHDCPLRRSRSQEIAEIRHFAQQFVIRHHQDVFQIVPKQFERPHPIISRW